MTTNDTKTELQAGWYLHPDMHKTIAFWDGSDWTDRVAPDPTGWTVSISRLHIAQGVALGATAAVALARLLFGI